MDYYMICMVLLANLIALSLGGGNKEYGQRAKNQIRRAKPLYLDGLVSHRWNTINRANGQNGDSVEVTHGGGEYRLTYVHVVDHSRRKKQSAFTTSAGGIGHSSITFKFMRPRTADFNLYEIYTYAIDNRGASSSRVDEPVSGSSSSAGSVQPQGSQGEIY